MNILFVGPYRQPDGWGMATRSYIKALATKHKNITTRPVYLATPDLKFDDFFVSSHIPFSCQGYFN